MTKYRLFELSQPHATQPTDKNRRLVLGDFGFCQSPIGASGSAPIYPDLYHGGSGRRAIRCQVSGQYFPSGRIVTDSRGRQVGDIYVTDGPRTQWR